MSLLYIDGLCDSHMHLLEMLNKDIDLEEFISNWKNNNGCFLIDIGINELDFENRISYSKLFNSLYFSVGIHPNYAGDDLSKRMLIIENNLKKENVVAIGETGLDYYWDKVDKITQKKFFVEHIKLSLKYDKPIIIHNRDACDDILSILSQYKGLRGIIHCYSSNRANLKRFLDLGFFISFAGNVTYKKNLELQECLKSVPTNRLLLETDSPYLSPVPLRGKINTPTNIYNTYKFTSEQTKIDIEKLKILVFNNICNVFNLENKND